MFENPEQMHDRLVFGLWQAASGDPRRFRSAMQDLADDWTDHERGAFFLNTGVTFHNHNRNDVALQAATDALDAFARIDNTLGQARASLNLGIYNDALGEFGQSQQCFNTALRLSRQLGDISLESKCYVGLGRLCNNLYRFDEAIDYFESGLALKQVLNETVGIGKCLNGLGLARHWQGDFAAAIVEFDKLLALEPDDPSTLLNKGNSLLSLGQLREALDLQQRAYTIARTINDGDLIGSTLNNLGIVYGYMGDFDEAIRQFEEALTYPISMSEQGSCYQNIGNALFNLSQFDEAMERLNKALQIKMDTGDWRGVALCSMNLGNVYGTVGKLGLAIKHHQQALAVALEHEDPYVAVQCHQNLGVTHLKLGKADDSLAAFRLALSQAEELGSLELCARCHGNLAVYEHKGMGNVEAAYEHCVKALELSKQVGHALIEDANRLAFSAKSARIFDTYIPVSLKLKGPSAGWEALEQSKAQALADLLRFGDIRPSTALPQDLRNRELALFEQIRAQQVGARAMPGGQAASRTAKELLGRFSDLYDEIRQIDPEYAALRNSEISSVAQVNGYLAEPEETIMVQYAVLPDEVLLFVLGAEGAPVHVETTAVSQVDLESMVRGYRDCIAQPSLSTKEKADRERWRKTLSELLVDPVSAYVDEAASLVCVPNGSLHYLPIQSLYFGSAPLISHVPVSYAPSASALRFLAQSRKRDVEEFASVGVEFEQEAHDVAEVFGATAVVGENATRQRFRECLSGYRIVHFSGHGAFHAADPLSSGLQLSDGVITAREIMESKIDASLVTLSACESGINRMTDGDDIIGFARAFFHAGAASLIASLWRVEAETTRELMSAFYAELVRGASKRSALQYAQKQLLAIRDDPYYWAPFLLFGDWE